MRCNKCGFENMNNVTICNVCGTPLVENSNANAQNIQNNNIVQNNKPNKSGTSKILIGIIAGSVVLLGGIIGANLLSGDKEKENKPSLNEPENTDNNSINLDYSKYTANFPKDERTIDYYWNINTAGFEKTKFDGRLSVFGTIMNTKLTGKTLKDAGFIVADAFSSDGKINKVSKLEYNDKYNYYEESIMLAKDGKVFPANDEWISLRNYVGKDDVYDDSTEVYYYTGTDSKFLTYEDVIVPYFEGIEFSKITIDAVIERLGVPTYVENRKAKLEDAKTSTLIRMDYVYVFDNYLVEFTFSYSKYIGVVFNNVSYMGKNEFSSAYYNYDVQTQENVKYESYIKFLEEQQNQYLAAIGKK